MSKCCSVCQIVKPMEDFRKDRSKGDGYATRCKICVRKIELRQRELARTGPPTTGEKECQACGLMLPVGRFGKNYTNSDGLLTKCKDCYRAALIKSREEMYANVEILVCPRCQYELPVVCFTRSEWSITGYRVYCKYCDYIRQAEKKNPTPDEPVEINRHPKEWWRYHPEMEGDYGTDRLMKAFRTARQMSTPADKKEIARAHAKIKNRLPAEVLAQMERSGRLRAKRLGLPTEKLDYMETYTQNSSCCLCGEVVAIYDLSFEHLIPLTRGGGHVKSNVFPAHIWCNIRKRDKTPSEYRAYLAEYDLHGSAAPAPLYPSAPNRILQTLLAPHPFSPLTPAPQCAKMAP